MSAGKAGAGPSPTNTHKCVYIYIYMCVCVCVCGFDTVPGGRIYNGRAWPKVKEPGGRIYKLRAWPRVGSKIKDQRLPRTPRLARAAPRVPGNLWSLIFDPADLLQCRPQLVHARAARSTDICMYVSNYTCLHAYTCMCINTHVCVCVSPSGSEKGPPLLFS